MKIKNRERKKEREGKGMMKRDMREIERAKERKGGREREKN